MQTLHGIDANTAKVLRKARNRLRSVAARFRGVHVPDDPSFVSFLNRHNGVACWFHRDTEPQLHAIAQQFESAYVPGEERGAMIADALRAW